MRVAIYARVSTVDKGQDVENQLIQLREYCHRQGWEIKTEYIDHVSGKSGDRDAFKRMFIDASRRQFDVVLVWALDRLTREGVYETFGYMKKLDDWGVAFESYTEAHFRTTGPAGELMLAVGAWIAKQERIRISERTKAGMSRARAQGHIAGRRERIFDRTKAIELRKAGLSWRALEQKFKIPQATIRLALAKCAAKVSAQIA